MGYLILPTMMKGNYAPSAPLANPDVRTTARSYYELLKVPSTASMEEIRMAWKKEVALLLSDGIGDMDKLEVINVAYETLADPQTRIDYDAEGETSLNFDSKLAISRDLFHEGLRPLSGPRQRPRRTRDIIHPISVTLEDLYKGKFATFSITRNIICKQCNGEGGINRDINICTTCGGEGATGAFREGRKLHSVCVACSGEGVLTSFRDECPICRGKKVVPVPTTMRARIEKGMEHGQRLALIGEGDQAPGADIGDVVILLQQETHPRFKRTGNNLHTKVEVDLLTALVGGKISVDHLNARVLSFALGGGEVTKKDGILKVIHNQGMPVYRKPGEFGDLYINFSITFPDRVEGRSVQLLRDALGPTHSMVEEDAFVEEVSLAEPEKGQGEEEGPDCNHQ
ncbi:putative YDJ1-mitochondrial and ER import protein [Ephemerocybe angulata]|uniref:Putative YDJ1-mitochondrial and ER import protein n=1 Tax=Ephemerocybe angulata TaxID=980116 RepID=A0A8H6II83_9AGAR|nr:putative YDJ1-mitochondrial and ER import protein [Tulosesus angulatus]